MKTPAAFSTHRAAVVQDGVAHEPVRGQAGLLPYVTNVLTFLPLCLASRTCKIP